MPAEAKEGGSLRDALKEAARIEKGMRNFLEEGGFSAFTTTFEDLHGLSQLPGLAVQRLMADGYGFGAEGDWKTAALVRAMKVMALSCVPKILRPAAINCPEGAGEIFLSSVTSVSPRCVPLQSLILFSVLNQTFFFPLIV